MLRQIQVHMSRQMNEPHIVIKRHCKKREIDMLPTCCLCPVGSLPQGSHLAVLALSCSFGATVARLCIHWLLYNFFCKTLYSWKPCKFCYCTGTTLNWNWHYEQASRRTLWLKALNPVNLITTQDSCESCLYRWMEYIVRAACTARLGGSSAVWAALTAEWNTTRGQPPQHHHPKLL